jgi:hypothetical protein
VSVQAAGVCASCKLPESAHRDGDREAAAVWGALAGCSGFRVRRAEARIPAQRQPARRSPCGRCGLPGHDREECPW